MGEHGALFYFLDGIQGWAKMELKRPEVQAFASAIVATELLTEFKRNVGRDEVRRLVIVVTVTKIEVSLIGGTSQQHQRT